MYGAPCAYGWLPRNLGPQPAFYGVPVGRHYPTRHVEFAFVLESLDAEERGTVCDVATGFNPDVHVLSLILARAGFTVRASDLNPETLDLYPHERITRVVEGMEHIEMPDESVDAVTCISTFEHVANDVRLNFLAEARRVLKPRGMLLITADWMIPEILAEQGQVHGFDIGWPTPFHGERLDPNISFLRARRLP